MAGTGAGGRDARSDRESPANLAGDGLLGGADDADDVTTFAAFEAAARDAHRHAELADSASRQEALVAAISHAVGNALTVIRLAAGTLERRDPADNAMAEPVATIFGAVDEIEALIDDIRIFRKLADPAVELHRSACQPNELLDAAAADVRGLASQDGIEVLVRTDPAPAILADRPLILRALQRVLARAIGASARGGRIVLSALTAPDAVTLAVTDAGSGADGSRIRELANRFDAAAEAEIGPGLALARAIAARHGGYMVATSDADSGTTIGLALVTQPAARTPAVGPPD